MASAAESLGVGELTDSEVKTGQLMANALRMGTNWA